MRKSFRKYIGAVAAVSVMTIGGIVYGFTAQKSVLAETNYDNRPTITRESFLDHVMFNSLTGSSNVYTQESGCGSEKNFVRARQYSPAEGSWACDEISSVKEGDVYAISLYVHNNASDEIYGDKVKAKDVTVSVKLPTGESSSQMITGKLYSSNASPQIYLDDVTLKADEKFSLEYVPGSAYYSNSVGDFKLSDEVINDDTTGSKGVKIGYTSMNGEIPGCYQFSGQLTILVKVKTKGDTTPKIKKEVSIKGKNDWKETVSAKVGEEVEFRVEYINAGNATSENVVLKDTLPKNLTYVNGTAEIYNANNKSGKSFDFSQLSGSGLNIGSYTAGSNAWLYYTAKVVATDVECGTSTMENWVSVTAGGKTTKDDASVKVTQVCREPEKPKCKYENGVYYDKDGNKTDKATYEAQCTEPEPEKPKCEEKNGVYYGEDGSVVSQETYVAQCSGTPKGSEPTEMPNTGAGEIASGAIGLGSIVTSLGYFIASRRKLI